MKKGLFITFEGPEGSGKSTQIRKLSEFLQNSGHEILVLREPGSTRIGEAIRQIILNKDFMEMDPSTELLLYFAARAQLVKEKILPALEKGTMVLCDRFEDSTVAYQGFGRGISVPDIQEISSLVVRGDLKPDVTFFLDINPAEGMKRGGRHDRMEKQSMDFHQKVYRGFREIAKIDLRRIRTIDASQPIEEVSKQIKEIVKTCLPQK